MTGKELQRLCDLARQSNSKLGWPQIAKSLGVQDAPTLKALFRQGELRDSDTPNTQGLENLRAAAQTTRTAARDELPALRASRYSVVSDALR